MSDFSPTAMPRREMHCVNFTVYWWEMFPATIPLYFKNHPFMIDLPTKMAIEEKALFRLKMLYGHNRVVGVVYASHFKILMTDAEIEKANFFVFSDFPAAAPTLPSTPESAPAPAEAPPTADKAPALDTPQPTGRTVIFDNATPVEITP